MTRSRVTFATIEAAAIAALLVSPSTTARWAGARGPSRKPSTRQARPPDCLACGARSPSTERRPHRFDLWSPLRSMAPDGITRTLILVDRERRKGAVTLEEDRSGGNRTE